MHWQDTAKYSMLGFKRPDLGKLNTKLKTKPKEIRNFHCAQCNAVVSKVEMVHIEPKNSYYCNASCKTKMSMSKRPSMKGIKRPSMHGKPSWNKGLPNPTAADNARKGAEKNSKSALGRKRFYLSETEWTWKYPDGDGWFFKNNNGERIPIV
jgi:hypothetical protein